MARRILKKSKYIRENQRHVAKSAEGREVGRCGVYLGMIKKKLMNLALCEG